MATIGFLGGTGPEGLGLALRFAVAGETVLIGSRQQERAVEAADSLRQKLPAHVPASRISGCDNATAARDAEIVTLTFPYAAVQPVLTELAPSVAGKLILDVVNPLKLRKGLFHMIPVEAGSAAELIRDLLPGSRVVSGFKNLSATELLDIEQVLHGDVLLCSDVDGAIDYFVELIAKMPRLRAVDAGSLANARHLESITTLLLNLNRRHDALTSIEILGLPSSPRQAS